VTLRLAATDHDSLEHLTGYVHDAWFDVERITRDGDLVSIPIALRGRRVEKRFLRRFKRSPGSYESLLTIRGVRDVRIHEPAEIAVYMINRFGFEPPLLTIDAEPDCTVTFEVESLHVEAELRTAEYDWSEAGATALVVPFPHAEPAIGDMRRAHTPSGREGMYPHNTLIAPFHHASRLDAMDNNRIKEALAPFVPFDVALASFGLFEHIGCLYLEPEPRERFVAVTEALLAAYPEIDYPPEGHSIVPHVTIGGHLSEEEQERIKRELEPQLPIRGRADRVTLVERGEDGRWFDRETFPLS
jgi:2'-5' RNA ligase